MSFGVAGRSVIARSMSPGLSNSSARIRNGQTWDEAKALVRTWEEAGYWNGPAELAVPPILAPDAPAAAPDRMKIADAIAAFLALRDGSNIRQIETKMWFLFVAGSYIDIGIEARISELKRDPLRIANPDSFSHAFTPLVEEIRVRSFHHR
jgi:hypothetical protein